MISDGGIAGPVQAAPRQAERPGAGFSVDVEQVVLRGRHANRRAPGRRRRRRPPAPGRRARRSSRASAYANGRAAPVRRRACGSRSSGKADAEQPLVLGHRAAHRRMMDHHDPEQAAFRPPASSMRAEPVRLVLAKEAVRHERRGGARGRHADQRDLPAHAQIGKAVPVGRRGWRRRRSSRRPRRGRSCRRRPAHRRRGCPARPRHHRAGRASRARCLRQFDLARRAPD